MIACMLPRNRGSGGMALPGWGTVARWAAIVVLSAMLLLVVYEVFAVLSAKARTADALAGVSVREVHFGDLSKRRIHVLLTVEDPSFFQNHGLDFTTPGQGMTTITQSLVKRMYFKHFHQGLAKIDQDLIARLVLDPAMRKRDQLEAFVNYSYFGHIDGRDVIGYPDAARTYYGKDLKALSDREFISLVAMQDSPDTLDPRRHFAANTERVNRIVRLLAHKCKPRNLTDVDYVDCAAPPQSH